MARQVVQAGDDGQAAGGIRIRPNSSRSVGLMRRSGVRGFSGRRRLRGDEAEGASWSGMWSRLTKRATADEQDVRGVDAARPELDRRAFHDLEQGVLGRFRPRWRGLWPSMALSLSTSSTKTMPRWPWQVAIGAGRAGGGRMARSRRRQPRLGQRGGVGGDEGQVEDGPAFRRAGSCRCRSAR